MYSAYGAIYTADVMSYIEWVLYHRYSGCDHPDTDMRSVMSSESEADNSGLDSYLPGLQKHWETVTRHQTQDGL